MNWYRLTAYALLRMFCDSYCTSTAPGLNTRGRLLPAPWYRCLAHALPWYSLKRKALHLQIFIECNRAIVTIRNLRWRICHPVWALSFHLDVKQFHDAWSSGNDLVAM